MVKEPEEEPDKDEVAADVDGLLDALPASLLSLLIFNLTSLCAAFGGSLPVGTLCSGTDLVVVWISAMLRAVSKRADIVFDWTHVFST